MFCYIIYPKSYISMASILAINNSGSILREHFSPFLFTHETFSRQSGAECQLLIANMYIHKNFSNNTCLFILGLFHVQVQYKITVALFWWNTLHAIKHASSTANSSIKINTFIIFATLQ